MFLSPLNLPAIVILSLVIYRLQVQSDTINQTEGKVEIRIRVLPSQLGPLFQVC